MKEMKYFICWNCGGRINMECLCGAELQAVDENGYILSNTADVDRGRRGLLTSE